MTPGTRGQYLGFVRNNSDQAESGIPARSIPLDYGERAMPGNQRRKSRRVPGRREAFPVKIGQAGGKRLIGHGFGALASGARR